MLKVELISRLTLIAAFAILAFDGFAQKNREKKSDINLRLLNPNAKIKDRSISNYAIDDSIEPKPHDNRSWLMEVFVEDDKGVLKSIKSEIKSWGDKEMYSSIWNLDSTKLYETPSRRGREKFLKKRLLKYTDKRLSGELKQAERGTSLYRARQVQKALKPNTTANLSKNVRLRFKARVLEGKIFMVLENPYLDYRANVNLRGEMEMTAKKELKHLRAEAKTQYNFDDKRWLTLMDRVIVRELKARVASEHRAREPSGKQYDQSLQLLIDKKL